VPNTFAPGTPAKAADVNDNFKAVADGVNTNAKAISALSSGETRMVIEGSADRAVRQVI
jgi:hypothetical protein